MQFLNFYQRMSQPKLTFSAYAAANDGELEIDWIEKKQLVQDFRRLSIDEKPCVISKTRASTATTK